jgi:hypothetical protein
VAQLLLPLLLWRYGRRCGTMTGVMSSQGVVPVLLVTMHGHVHPIDGSECRSWGPPWLPVLPKVFTCLSGEVEVRRGRSGALITSWGLGRGENYRPRHLSCSRPL